MSRYVLLLLLNIPFIVAGFISALTQFKLGKLSRRRFLAQTAVWCIILIGLILAEPLYTWLYSHDLTETEPLSLFDVIQITAIVILFYLANRARSKIEDMEKRLRDLHQELSIVLSEKPNR